MPLLDITLRKLTFNSIIIYTTTTYLMILYSGEHEWAGTRNNIHLFTPYLCGYYSISL